LTFLSPAAKAGADGKTSDDDPAERDAVETFRQVIETVKLLDRSMVREDQTQRLFRTRALFVGFTEARMKKALAGEMWLRLSENGIEANAISWLYVSFDRRHEDWTSALQLQETAKKTKNVVHEVGASDRTVSRVLDRGAAGSAARGADGKEPPVRQEEAYTLTV